MQVSLVLKKNNFRQVSSSVLSLSYSPVTGLPRIKMRTMMHRCNCGDMNASIMKMTRGLARVHKRCSLALGIARSYFLSFLRRNLRDPIIRHVSTWRIWLVYCFVTLLGFSGQPKPFWASCIGRPISRPIFVRFWSGKKQFPSQDAYFNISTGNFWPKYPFK